MQDFMVEKGIINNAMTEDEMLMFLERTENNNVPQTTPPAELDCQDNINPPAVSRPKFKKGGASQEPNSNPRDERRVMQAQTQGKSGNSVRDRA